LKNMFQSGDRARRSSVGQTAVERQLRGPKVVLPLDRGPVLTSDTIQPIGGVELRKPGTDAVIITRGTLCALPWKLPNYWSAKVCKWGCLTCVGSRHSNGEAIRSAATRANGKVVVAHEANVTGGFGAEIVARFARAIRKRRAAKN
jgi:pyruvate/2-oxoglutarate/acetoin dehydrogenase E1 component